MVPATIDANVFVSAFITPAGTPHQIWQAWRRGLFTLVSSDHIVRVTLAKLRSPRLTARHFVSSAELALFEALVRERARMVEIAPGDVPVVTGDPEDDTVLAIAHRGGARFLVTGDTGLLDLGAYEGVTIITPRALPRPA
jgi:uncharacterized protein